MKGTTERNAAIGSIPGTLFQHNLWFLSLAMPQQTTSSGLQMAILGHF